jgi:hypothetical protein
VYPATLSERIEVVDETGAVRPAAVAKIEYQSGGYIRGGDPAIHPTQGVYTLDEMQFAVISSVHIHFDPPLTHSAHAVRLNVDGMSADLVLRFGPPTPDEAREASPVVAPEVEAACKLLDACCATQRQAENRRGCTGIAEGARRVGAADACRDGVHAYCPDR